MKIKASTDKRPKFLTNRDLKAHTMYWIEQQENSIFIPYNDGGGDGVIIDLKAGIIFHSKWHVGTDRTYQHVAKSFTMTITQDLE